MNLLSANLEAQRRWGPCGCAWYGYDEATTFGTPRGYTVGLLMPAPSDGTKYAYRILGQGATWESAFDGVLLTLQALRSPMARCGDPSTFAPVATDEQIRDMAAPLSDADPKYRVAVMRVEAAMKDASKMLGIPSGELATPDVVAQVVAITGFILAERART